MRGHKWALPLVLLALSGCRPSTVWSPDGKQLAMDVRGVLFTFDRASGKFTRRSQGARHAWSPAWSPDEKRLLYHRVSLRQQKAETTVASMSLVSLDLASGRERVIVPRLSLYKQKPSAALKFTPPADLYREVMTATYSPDGRRIAFMQLQGTESVIYTANADGSGSKRLVGGEESVLAPSWSPDGTTLAFLSTTPVSAGPVEAGDVELEVIRADGSGRRKLWRRDRSPRLRVLSPVPQWSADGKHLGVVLEADAPDIEMEPGRPGRDGELWTIPIAGGEPRRLWRWEGPNLFATVSSGFKGLVYYPMTATQKEPPFATLLHAPWEKPTTLFQVRAPGADGALERPPISSVSPDGSTVACVLVPQEPQRSPLLLIQTAGGDLQRFTVPKTSPAAPWQAAPAKKLAIRPAKPR